MYMEKSKDKNLFNYYNHFKLIEIFNNNVDLYNCLLLKYKQLLNNYNFIVTEANLLIYINQDFIHKYTLFDTHRRKIAYAKNLHIQYNYILEYNKD